MNSENEKSLRTFINDIYDSVRLPSDAIMKQPSPETIIELFIDLVVTNPSNKNDIILKLYIENHKQVVSGALGMFYDITEDIIKEHRSKSPYVPPEYTKNVFDALKEWKPIYTYSC